MAARHKKTQGIFSTTSTDDTKIQTVERIAAGPTTGNAGSRATVERSGDLAETSFTGFEPPTNRTDASFYDVGQPKSRESLV